MPPHHTRKQVPRAKYRGSPFPGRVVEASVAFQFLQVTTSTPPYVMKDGSRWWVSGMIGYTVNTLVYGWVGTSWFGQSVSHYGLYYSSRVDDWSTVKLIYLIYCTTISVMSETVGSFFSHLNNALSTIVIGSVVT